MDKRDIPPYLQYDTQAKYFLKAYDIHYQLTHHPDVHLQLACTVSLFGIFHHFPDDAAWLQVNCWCSPTDNFLADPGVPGVRSMGPYLCLSETFLKLKWCDPSWSSYKLNMTIQGDVAMQVTQPGGQLWNQYEKRHLMTKRLCGATWWPNLKKAFWAKNFHK